jgi:hypothetical protein
MIDLPPVFIEGSRFESRFRPCRAKDRQLVTIHRVIGPAARGQPPDLFRLFRRLAQEVVDLA